MRACWVTVLALVLTACRTDAPPPTPLVAKPSSRPFLPSRIDYEAFRVLHPELEEPNYLPFMAHRFSTDEEDWIVFCRFDDARFPLKVHIETPTIDVELGAPRDPLGQEFVTAAAQAVAAWEEALPATHRMVRTPDRSQADLIVHLRGERGPHHRGGTQVLGGTPMQGACALRGGDPAAGRLDARFDVAEMEVFVADRHGLLTPKQVGGIVLHEMGHALGMRGHSPIPAHLMYGETRDRPLEALAAADIHSFRALYALPSGSLYARVPRGESMPRPPIDGPVGPVTLNREPYIDANLGFALHVPEGWQLVSEGQRITAIDGVSWDYDASFSVTVRAFGSVSAYLEQHERDHFARKRVVSKRSLELKGYPVQIFRVFDPAQQLVGEQAFLETGDGRVVILESEAPVHAALAFRPWLRAMMDHFEVRAASPRGS